jgi:hypothetical protein
VGDWNGDGKDDLIHLVADYANVWLSNGDGTFQLPRFTPSGGNYNTSAGIWMVGDWNGDGKDDLVHILPGNAAYANNWKSEGSSFFTIQRCELNGETASAEAAEEGGKWKITICSTGQNVISEFEVEADSRGQAKAIGEGEAARMASLGVHEDAHLCGVSKV